jgi:hypothetical protein
MPTSPTRKDTKGPILKRILVRCPSTAKLAPTGLTIEESRFETAHWKNPKVSCPYCQRVHIWTKKDVVLAR